MILKVHVLTPKRVICKTTATEVIIPGIDGRIGVLDNHAPLLTSLGIGLLKLKISEKWMPVLILGGFAEIDRNNVTILASEVEEFLNVSNETLTQATKEAEKAVAEARKLISEISDLDAEARKGKKKLLDAFEDLKIAKARLECIELQYIFSN